LTLSCYVKVYSVINQIKITKEIILMREAVIVATARTPIGKAYRGSFNNTHAQTLAGHAISEAVKRAKVEPSDIDDVVLGAAAQQGTQ
jgi:acetyl-CoA C-acetyltransferase